MPDDLPLDPEGPAPTAASDTPRRSNRQIGLTVFGVMLAMAGIALIYALATVDFRRANDHKSQDAKMAAVVAVPPNELAALAYLPADIELVAGLAAAQALETESGKVLLNSLMLNGFTPEQIDHVVVATGDLNTLPPRLTIVVRSRRPLDLVKLRAALKADQSVQRNGRTTYIGKLPFGTVDGAITFADERTLVAALKPEDLDVVPKTAAGGVGRFPQPVRDSIDKLPSDTPAWLVAHKKPNNAALALALGLTKVPPDVMQGILKLSSLSAHATERKGRIEVIASAKGLDAKETTAITDALKDAQAGRWTTDGVDPFLLTWSESVAGLKQLLPPRP
ncbi:MAG: hypothetical protein U0746_21420 [Gemmataceae bacterium]